MIPCLDPTRCGVRAHRSAATAYCRNPSTSQLPSVAPTVVARADAGNRPLRIAVRDINLWTAHDEVWAFGGDALLDEVRLSELRVGEVEGGGLLEAGDLDTVRSRRDERWDVNGVDEEDWNEADAMWQIETSYADEELADPDGARRAVAAERLPDGSLRLVGDQDYAALALHHGVETLSVYIVDRG